MQITPRMHAKGRITRPVSPKSIVRQPTPTPPASPIASPPASPIVSPRELPRRESLFGHASVSGANYNRAVIPMEPPVIRPVATATPVDTAMPMATEDDAAATEPCAGKIGHTVAAVIDEVGQLTQLRQRDGRRLLFRAKGYCRARPTQQKSQNAAHGSWPVTRPRLSAWAISLPSTKTLKPAPRP